MSTRDAGDRAIEQLIPAGRDLKAGNFEIAQCGAAQPYSPIHGKAAPRAVVADKDSGAVHRDSRISFPTRLGSQSKTFTRLHPSRCQEVPRRSCKIMIREAFGSGSPVHVPSKSRASLAGEWHVMEGGAVGGRIKQWMSRT